MNSSFKLIKKILPIGHRLRTNKKTTMTTLTIHSTGNPTSTEHNERGWLDNPSNTRQASWHYTVGAVDVVQAIPEDEIAWHAGTASGNNSSIGIEIIESGNRRAVLNNAVKFVASLLKEKGWGVDRLRKHKDWSGKDCPRILINKNYIKEGMDWDWFVSEVNKELNNLKNQNKKPHWAEQSVRYCYDNNILTDYDLWLKKVEDGEKVEASFLLTMLMNMHKNLKGLK